MGIFIDTFLTSELYDLFSCAKFIGGILLYDEIATSRAFPFFMARLAEVDNFSQFPPGLVGTSVSKKSLNASIFCIPYVYVKFQFGRSVAWNIPIERT